jgi:chromosome segregation ATPase
VRSSNNPTICRLHRFTPSPTSAHSSHHHHKGQQAIEQRLGKLEEATAGLHRHVHSIESHQQHQLGHLESSIDFLRDRLEGNLQRQIAHVESNVDYLRGDVHDVRRDVHDAERQVDSLETKSGITNAKLHSIEREVDVEAAGLHRVSHEMDADKARLLRDEEDISGLKRDVHDLKHEVSADTAGLHRVDHAVTANANRLNRDEAEISDLKQDVRDLHHHHHHSAPDHEVGRLRREVHSLQHEVGAEAAGVRHVDHEVRATAERLRRDEHDISDLRRDVHHLHHHHLPANEQAVSDLTKEVHGLKREVDAEAVGLHRVSHEVKVEAERLHHDEHDISDLRRDVRELQHHGLHHAPHHSPHGHVEQHSAEWHESARVELTIAKQEIQRVMATAIGLEADHSRAYPGEVIGEDYPERYHKVANEARHIFRDVRRFLTPSNVDAMEEEGRLVDRRWNELFKNAQSIDVARAYFREVKHYCARLDEVISTSLEAVA